MSRMARGKNIYERSANILASKTYTNPFNRAQARDFSDRELEKDFVLTSQYLDAFQNRHQVLLGTRGSGRTILLRMMGSHTRAYLKETYAGDPDVKKLPTDVVAFYVRMALEWVAMAMGGENADLRFFQAAFNIRASTAFCCEVRNLIATFKSVPLISRATIEQSVVQSLVRAWNLPIEPPADLHRLSIELEALAQELDPENHDSYSRTGVFARAILSPIEAVAERVSAELVSLTGSPIKFYACIDEAEFLPAPFLASIATAMRSSKKCVIKLATLFYHFDEATSVPGVKLSLGNDYTILTVDPTPKVFARIADHLVRVRLDEVGLRNQSLASFLGVAGEDRPIDYYALIVKKDLNIEALHSSIFTQLTDRRKAYVIEAGSKGNGTKNPIDLKYAPVFYAREVKKLLGGNRKLGYFAGPNVVRLVANGNPRRFLEIMEMMFDRARERDLGFGIQQEVLMRYSRSLKDRAGGISPLLQVFIEVVGAKLSERVHNGDLNDTGCSFVLSDFLAGAHELRDALKQGVAYAHVVPDGQAGGLVSLPERMCIAYGHAVRFWLPLRVGVAARISNGNVDISAFLRDAGTGPSVMGRADAKQYVRQLQLNLTFDRELEFIDDVVERLPKGAE